MLSRIEAAMTKELGVPSKVTILTAEELAAIVATNPLAIAVAKAIGDGATTRHWTTLTKLHAIASPT
jgi:uncharacterized protein (DUF1697 family)